MVQDVIIHCDGFSLRRKLNIFLRILHWTPPKSAAGVKDENTTRTDTPPAPKHKRVTLSTDGRFELLTVYFLSISLEEIFFLLLTLCGGNKDRLIMCWEHNNAARLHSSAHLDAKTPFHFAASFINIIFPKLLSGQFPLILAILHSYPLTKWSCHAGLNRCLHGRILPKIFISLDKDFFLDPALFNANITLLVRETNNSNCVKTLSSKQSLSVIHSNFCLNFTPNSVRVCTKQSWLYFILAFLTLSGFCTYIYVPNRHNVKKNGNTVNHLRHRSLSGTARHCIFRVTGLFDMLELFVRGWTVGPTH